MNLTDLLPTLLPALLEPTTAIVLIAFAALAVVGLALTKIPGPK